MPGRTMQQTFFLAQICKIMAYLAAKRPIFHSEADFQFALAWEIQQRNSALKKVRLEHPFEDDSDAPRKYLDIFVGDLRLAIELKYMTKKLKINCNGEDFSLRDQSAHNIRRYDFVKDIQRLETTVRKGQADAGLAIALTNHKGYWEESQNQTKDAAFRLDNGKVFPSGKKLSWRNDTCENTKREKEPIQLDGKYRICWCPYSSGKGFAFQYLAIPVVGKAGVVGKARKIDAFRLLGEALADSVCDVACCAKQKSRVPAKKSPRITVSGRRTRSGAKKKHA